MDNRYKLIILNNRIYKEVELLSERGKITIGTTLNCKIRFNKELFFSEFELDLEYEDGSWNIRSKEDIFFTDDGVMKYNSKALKHGDELLVKYSDSNYEVFKINFMINFELESGDYHRVIFLDKCSEIKIGGLKNCNLYLNNSLIGSDYITLTRNNKGFIITDNNTKYGVYVNGNRIKETAELKNYDFFSILGYSFYLKDNKLYTSSKENTITINGLKFEDICEQKSNLSYPMFNRNTRIKSVVSDEKIDFLKPPEKPKKPKKNIITSLLPALVMVGLVLLLRNSMGGGGSFIIFSACSMGVGVLTSIIALITGNKEYKKSVEERITNYNAYVEEKKKEIESLQKEELTSLENTYYPINYELRMVDEFSGDLFDRIPEDEDFLHVRLGTGHILASREVDYKKEETIDKGDEISQLGSKVAAEYRYLENAPVVSKFSECNAVGIIGKTHQLYDMMKNITIDICTRHYHNDVKTFYIVDKKNADNISWIRWFLHVNNEHTRNIICDEDSKDYIFEYLYRELSARESNENKKPHFVIFVFNDVGIKTHPLSKYIEKSNEYGFTFIFFENYKELLPLYCDNIVMLESSNDTGILVESEDKNTATEFVYDTIDDEEAESVALKLAPVYCEEVSLENELTKSITFFNMLNIISPEDIDLSNRWQNSKIDKSMAAPLGVRKNDEIVYLDLHEKYHGPHGLVAGTTGSGKSEIIQSYILAMSTLFHPYEVSFVIIDFKGGGMVNQFKSLPHLNGAITNIDEHEIYRSLMSIKAELKKRQRYFAESNVNQIDAYIKKYKNGEVKNPLPHLIIVVDEFAELKAEQPDFMKELISTARIGRSLGVHLILATQKPAGVVSDQIWSNSKFKLCLKVQNKEDSNEVLKSPLAAEIKEPGRAYLQVGNNEIFELFQSAYSGGPAYAGQENVGREYEILKVDLSGKRQIIFKHEKNKSEKESVSQLTSVVKYINDYCISNNIKNLPDICMPPLPSIIEFPKNINKEKDILIKADLGIYDDPENQYQGEADINITLENTFILGSAQFGKTNLLQSLIRSLASKYSPKEVNIYILDFASMVLKNFEGLNHIGGVVTVAEDEKLKNLFKLIKDEISQRKEKLLSVGVSSFASYKEAGYEDLPQIVLIIDNLTALREIYFKDDDEAILNVCREGLGVGISIVIANSQTTGIGYKYLSNFSSRIALYCNDSNEYGSLFDTCREKLSRTAGLAFIERDKKRYRCQTYLAFNGEKEIDRANEMKEFIKKTNDKYDHKKIKLIPEVPKVLDINHLKEHYPKSLTNDYKIVVGLNYESVEPVVIDFSKLSMLAITGKPKFGKCNFVKYVINYLNENSKNIKSEVHIIDDINRKFENVSKYKNVKNYTLDISKIGEILNDCEEKLKIRFENLAKDNKYNLDKEPLLLLIIQNMDVLNTINSNEKLLQQYKDIIMKYKDLKVSTIFANFENAQIVYSSGEAKMLVKENAQYLVFEDLDNYKIADVNYVILKQYKKELEVGDAYLFKNNKLQKIKTVFNK